MTLNTNNTAELSSMRIKMWVRFRFCWARRRAGPDLSAPPLPETTYTPPTASSLQDVTSDDDDLAPRYPFLELYHSAEEAITQMQRRKEHEGEFPECEVRAAWERKKLGVTQSS